MVVKTPAACSRPASRMETAASLSSFSSPLIQTDGMRLSYAGPATMREGHSLVCRATAVRLCEGQRLMARDAPDRTYPQPCAPMRLIDLSQPLYDGCPNCPAHPPVQSTIIADHARDGWRVELLTLSNHTGSHIDAPLHKLAGARSLDDMPLERFVGK